MCHYVDIRHSCTVRSPSGVTSSPGYRFQRGQQWRRAPAHHNVVGPGFPEVRSVPWCAGHHRQVYRVVPVLMASLSHPTETVAESRTVIWLCQCGRASRRASQAESATSCLQWRPSPRNVRRHWHSQCHPARPDFHMANNETASDPGCPLAYDPAVARSRYRENTLLISQFVPSGRTANPASPH